MATITDITTLEAFDAAIGSTSAVCLSILRTGQATPALYCTRWRPAQPSCRRACTPHEFPLPSPTSNLLLLVALPLETVGMAHCAGGCALLGAMVRALHAHGRGLQRAREGRADHRSLHQGALPCWPWTLQTGAYLPLCWSALRRSELHRLVRPLHATPQSSVASLVLTSRPTYQLLPLDLSSCAVQCRK